MAVRLSPVFNNDGSQIDSNGAPRSGAKLFTYAAGTTTAVTTYKERTGSTAHTNPIILDANGLSPAPIWLPEGSTYKFVLAPSNDTAPPASPYLTIDHIVPINDVAATTATEWTASGMTDILYVSATSFTVAGDQTSILEVGRRLKSTVTAGTVYSTITKSVFGAVTTVTVENDSGTLDSGLSAFSYGQISVANTSLPFVSRDQQCGRLVYVSATQIRLDPHDGNTIWVFTGSAWRRRTIPSAGVTAANTSIYLDGTSGQSLVADKAYFVYLFDNAGTLTMDFSETAPAVDATSGLKIKTGVATRLLIGMVRTNASTPGQFQASPLVLSWYRRRGIKASAALTTQRDHTSTSAIEVNAEIRTGFLTWAEETVVAQFYGYCGNSGQNGNVTQITLDGIVTIVTGISVKTPVNGYWDNVSMGAPTTVAEGYHYMTITVAVIAGTGSWYAGTLSVVTRG